MTINDLAPDVQRRWDAWADERIKQFLAGTKFMLNLDDLEAEIAKLRGEVAELRREVSKK